MPAPDPLPTEADRAAAGVLAGAVAPNHDIDPTYHRVYNAFLAGVLHERERAARVAERLPPWSYDEYNAGDIAAAIRRGG